MEWLKDTYRILYSRIKLNERTFNGNIYNDNSFHFIYERLMNYKENANLFCTFGYPEDELPMNTIVAIVTDLQIIENKFCFTLHELKPDIFKSLRINLEDYEIDINIEGHKVGDEIRVERVSSILSIVRKINNEQR